MIDLNSSLDPGVGTMSPGVKVTRFGATDLDAEVPGRAQQAILGGVHVAGTSAPQIWAPSSASCILAPSIDLKSETKFPLPTLLSFLHPLSVSSSSYPAQSLESTDLTLDTWI